MQKSHATAPGRRRPQLWLGALGSVLLWAAPGFALELEVPRGIPSTVGDARVFTATVSGATGDVTYEWRFGEADFTVGGAEMSHVFTAPGHYSIDVVATDANGDTASAYFQHLVHYPLTPARPAASSSIVYDAARNRIYSVNQDNDSVTSIDPDNLVNLGELAVYHEPESLALTPEGKLWVVHRGDYAVAVIDPDQFVIERGFRLPYASQPVSIAISPTGDAAYVTLMALGLLLKLDPTTGATVAEVDVGPRPRGIAISHDGNDVYVTRFVSPDTGGEVVKVQATTMTVATRILLPLDSETEDSDLQARGLPNYLFSVALTPDGRQAWVPGKKDNTLRGPLRDGQTLTHDTTVRPLTSIVDTQTAQEIYDSRIDLDDRSMPFHVEFTPYGNFAILTLAGSNRIEVRDVSRPTQVFSAIANAGIFPRASVLAPSGRLFVQGALSRNVLAYDMSALLDDYDQSTPVMLGEIPTVANEKLPPQVLEGKRLFHDAEDTRMAFEGYIACGACHFEGLDDGRVYDFSATGEGLRNTVALLGRKGNGQGRLNWTGNFDEVQDLEHQIREVFDGLGLLPDEVYEAGTHNQPLGDPKAGLSPELDALAAYVNSLDRVNPSPYRNPDGSLTPDGEAGKLLFGKLGCGVCHGGPEFTDSARGSLHDVGTLTPLSGTRQGETLFGIDTPTLLGVWETAPYLHDGSAPTLRDVITTKNTANLHGYVSALSTEQIDDLVAFLLQIDHELPQSPLPFEPPIEGGTGGSSTEVPPAPADSSRESSCACRIVTVSGAGGTSSGQAPAWWTLGLLGATLVRRRRRAPISGQPGEGGGP